MAQETNTLHRLKLAIDSAHTATNDTRERSADDWMFAHFNHWDETLEEYSDNEYRGQFDILTRQLRQIKGEMLANPISVRFRPAEDEEEYKEGAEVMQGMYRASMRSNAAKEAVDVAIDCQVSAGFGAWRIVTEYEDDSDSDDDKQVIKRVPIHEAHNVVYFDPMAKRRDKSDAKWACILTWYTDDGMKDLLEQYGEDCETDSSFASPADSYVYPWTHGGRTYVGEFYEVQETKRRVAVLRNFEGDKQVVDRKDQDKIDDLTTFGGYSVVAKKNIKSKKVVKYLVTGDRILEGPTEIAGKHIPIVPVYGEWRFIEGQEWWEGMVRRAKDPQRLHNMAFSFIADQVGRSPRRKPIFTDEQISGYEAMYAQDANAAYYLMNSVNPMTGAPIDRTVQYLEGPTLSGTEVQFLNMTEKAVQDVTVTPLVGDKALSDGVTEGQLRLANASSQMQTFIFQDGLATAMRRDGEIFASIAAEIYTEERKIITSGEDDTIKTVMINQVAYGQDGLPTVKNDITDVEFEVYTDIGPSYSDKREAAMDKLRQLAVELGPQSQLGNIATIAYASMLDVPGTEALEKFSKEQLLMMGLRDPEDEDDMRKLQMAMQNQKPDPNMVLAQAEDKKAQADLVEAQIKLQQSQYDAVKAMAQTEKTRAETAAIIKDLQPDQLEELNKYLDTLKKRQELMNQNQYRGAQ